MSETTGVEVTRDEARRIAVRAQLLDGSATGVLETVRRLRYLQLDPISTVAPPQHLVLFSRLGSGYDRAELDRLPDTADLVVRARPEAATAGSAVLRRDLTSGLDRLLGHRVER